ncbi:MAG TPA: glycosyltransferase family 9 protein [Pyrinomonadaceae bacterium]|nr:glycosyltransferase family 9 protein [Pyrinomonadaceae bacterium]
MNSLREIVELSPRMRGLAMHALREEESPQPLGPSRWDWRDVRKILLVRLRSIGDTVLATPSLFALKRFLPQAQIDILLEDWVAPVLSGYAHADNVITLQRNSVTSRALVARKLRAARYDVVYNLHGGTTSTILTRASGAKHRVGYASYQYARLHNQLSPSPLLLWGREKTHSVEQQLALLGWTGVPVSDGPPTQLGLTAEAVSSVKKRLVAAGLDEQQPFALVHPAAAFATKQWGTDKFARIAEKLAERNIPSVALVAAHEALIRDELQRTCGIPLATFDDLSLPEVSALAARARLFVGNDSGIAHIAAAMGVPSVVIFGSSNRAHWQPLAKAPAEVVFEEMPCQPCHGYFCEKFDQPECIIRVPVERVTAAIDRILRNNNL